jgi:3-oxoacyl-[acyl-carrier-protein] synthase-3
MNGAILRRLLKLEEQEGIADGIMPMTISYLGNSSVATVPTMLDLMVTGNLENQKIDSGDIVVFAAVGAGMNTNSVVYKWP